MLREILKSSDGFTIDEFKEYIDIDLKSWKGDISQIRWHPNCYPTFTSSRNLQFITSPGSSSESVESVQHMTRSKRELPNLKSNCFFCGFQKDNKDSKLCLVQFENVIQQLENQCNLKNDITLQRKIGVDFSNLPALEAKYDASCYEAYMRPVHHITTPIENTDDYAFALLAQYMDPLLTSGCALTIHSLLDKFKHFLEDQGYELYDS